MSDMRMSPQQRLWRGRKPGRKQYDGTHRRFWRFDLVTGENERGPGCNSATTGPLGNWCCGLLFRRLTVTAAVAVTAREAARVRRREGRLVHVRHDPGRGVRRRRREGWRR